MTFSPWKFASTLAVTPALLIALAACSSEPAPIDAASETPTVSASSPTPVIIATKCPQTPIDVAIAYELVTDSSGGITINVATNLPDGSDMNADFFVENGFLAQDEGFVTDGKISFGPFSDKGTPLHGDYEMSITLPIARNQPKAVQACIGEAGENLTGPLVSTEATTGDKIASLEALVTIN